MDVMVVGGGGREHALAWKLAQSALVDKVYCAPGNPGMRDTEAVSIQPDAAERLAAFAQARQIDLTVVGPEAPLCAGIADVFQAHGLRVFGPSAAAARLEGSKTFAKDFMARHGIPTGAAETFTDATAACGYIRRLGAPLVVKADGLAAGKGVFVAATEAEAIAAVDACFSGRFGAAGRAVLVEECLVGEEASILALTDGRTILPLASSQDHKRVGVGDTGPNTGGMGAYSPAPVVDEVLWAEIRSRILDRFLAGCNADGLDYRGVIYAGVMVTASGPKVLEFNVRFGDPETQAVLPRLESDLAEAMLAVTERRLAGTELRWTPDPAVCVVMAAAGYPGTYRRGCPITGIEAAEATGALVFHAGTDRQDGQLVTAGGRILGVTATGNTIQAAAANAYRAVDCIQWQGCQFRCDIAHRAIARLEADA